MSFSKTQHSSPSSSPRSYYTTSSDAASYNSGNSPVGASPTSIRSFGTLSSLESQEDTRSAPHLPKDFSVSSQSMPADTAKAVRLLEKGFKPKPTHQSSLAARHAAVRRYEDKKRVTKERKARERANELCRLVMEPTRKENLAESNRPKKLTTPEEDFETFDDLKGSDHVRAQREAKQRALQLLDSITQGLS